tara:strand:- start:1812 stop:2303 length:492 start_codon:yes stop_codon:yes gene_type:complete
MNKNELLKQIHHYNLSSKLKTLAENDQKKRPFRHLPKQFSKGILIGNIAIVPKKSTDTRYVYVIADMIEAKVLHDNISLKQTAIMIAHYLAEGQSAPDHLIEQDTAFASKIFDISNFKRMQKDAHKQGDEELEFVYENKFVEANRAADELKHTIQTNFNSLFS